MRLIQHLADLPRALYAWRCAEGLGELPHAHRAHVAQELYALYYLARAEASQAEDLVFVRHEVAANTRVLAGLFKDRNLNLRVGPGKGVEVPILDVLPATKEKNTRAAASRLRTITER